MDRIQKFPEVIFVFSHDCSPDVALRLIEHFDVLIQVYSSKKFFMILRYAMEFVNSHAQIMKNIPEDWNEQRRLFGFPER